MFSNSRRIALSCCLAVSLIAGMALAASAPMKESIKAAPERAKAPAAADANAAANAAMMNSTGMADSSGKALTMTSDAIGMDGKPMKSRTVLNLVDDHTCVWSMYGNVGGQEVKMMEITYTRAQ